MSWAWPGRTSETHNGRPSGANSAWNVPAEIMDLPRVPQVDYPALGADGLLPAPVSPGDFAVQDHVRQPAGPGALECLAQARGTCGEHHDHLVQVPVRGRLGQPEAPAQPGDAGLVAEPHEREDP